MIKPAPDGDGHIVDFRDWTPEMMCLASRMHDLPLRPGKTIRRHEVGIDRLAKLKFGYQAIGLLCDYVDELEFCPSEEEVVRLGHSLLLMVGEMELVRRRMRLERIKRQAQARKERLKAPGKSKPKIVLRRGN